MPPVVAKLLLVSPRAQFIGALIASFIVGCSPTEPVQTVAWYVANEAARQSMLAKCNANPGELGESPNCINAAAAANEVRYRVPPPSDRSQN
jgi:hypothetical protein